MQISYSKAWNMLSTLEENLGFHSLTGAREENSRKQPTHGGRERPAGSIREVFGNGRGNLQMKLLQNAGHAMIKTNTVKIS